MKKIKVLSPFITSIISFILTIITLYIAISNYYDTFDDSLSIFIFILSFLPTICFLLITIYEVLTRKNKIKIWVLVLVSLLSLLYYYLILFMGLFFPDCSKDILQSVESPNGEYTIKTYRKNCSATVDFHVIGELCHKNNKCKKIYDCYHEEDSFVYWIDNENIFINNKKMNIYKDKYDWRDDDNYQERLYEK